MIEQLKSILSSTTNVQAYFLTFGLIFMAIFSLVYYPMSLFEKIFTVYVTYLMSVNGFKQGRSMPEQKEGKDNTITTTVSKEIKPIDNTQS